MHIQFIKYISFGHNYLISHLSFPIFPNFIFPMSVIVVSHFFKRYFTTFFARNFWISLKMLVCLFHTLIYLPSIYINIYWTKSINAFKLIFSAVLSISIWNNGGAILVGVIKISIICCCVIVSWWLLLMLALNLQLMRSYHFCYRAFFNKHLDLFKVWSNILKPYRSSV